MKRPTLQTFLQEYDKQKVSTGMVTSILRFFLLNDQFEIILQDDGSHKLPDSY